MTFEQGGERKRKRNERETNRAERVVDVAGAIVLFTLSTSCSQHTQVSRFPEEEMMSKQSTISKKKRFVTGYEYIHLSGWRNGCTHSAQSLDSFHILFPLMPSISFALLVVQIYSPG